MTSFETLYDLFMTTTITDQRLNKLYKNDEEAFYDFLRAFLTKSIMQLSTKLITPLDYHCEEEIKVIDGVDVTVIRYYFDNDLLPLEQSILINSLAIHWYEKETEDITEISSRLATKDAKENNARSNLKEKNIRIRELYSALEADIRSLQYSNLSSIEGWY